VIREAADFGSIASSDSDSTFCGSVSKPGSGETVGRYIEARDLLIECVRREEQNIQLQLIAVSHGELVEQVLMRHPGMGHSWVSLKGQISKENPTVAFFVYPAKSATNFHHSMGRNWRNRSN
jgi:hypothetical protein